MGEGALSGTWYIMPTAFGQDGALDLASQRSLTEAVLDWGAEGLTVLGVMGEASALDTAERAAVISAVVEAAAIKPLVP
jgi:4-hydroxy-tetrahydrodipicolinate synthase